MKKYIPVCGVFARCLLPWFLIVLALTLAAQGAVFASAAMHPPMPADEALDMHTLNYVLTRSAFGQLSLAVLFGVLLHSTSAKNSRLADTLDRLPLSKNQVLACQTFCFALCFVMFHLARAGLLMLLSAGFADSMGWSRVIVVQEFFDHPFLRSFIPIMEPWKQLANLVTDLSLGFTAACNAECLRRDKKPVSGVLLLLLLLITCRLPEAGMQIALVGSVLLALYAYSEVSEGRREH